MKKINFPFAASLFAVLFCGTMTVRLEAQPTKSTYQITSGTYRVEGGLVGSIVYPLPRDEQALIVLMHDSDTSRARLEIVSRDSSSAFLTLPNGVVSSNEIRFQYTGSVTSDVPADVTVDYGVTNNGDSISLSGYTLLSHASPCNDCPGAFVHLDVRASLLPSLSIRVVNEVEVCWNTASNRTYQVRYSSDLTTNLWTDFGSPVQGDGLAHCIQDKVIAGDGKRFYSVLLLR